MMIRFVPLLYTICVSFSLFFMPCSCVRNENLSIERAIITDSIVSLREQGNMLRNESRFDEALEAHSRSLHLAESVADTLETVKALNNIGTDYRRLGILDVWHRSTIILRGFSAANFRIVRMMLVRTGWSRSTDWEISICQ